MKITLDCDQHFSIAALQAKVIAICPGYGERTQSHPARGGPHDSRSKGVRTCCTGRPAGAPWRSTRNWPPGSSDDSGHTLSKFQFQFQTSFALTHGLYTSDRCARTACHEAATPSISSCNRLAPSHSGCCEMRRTASSMPPQSENILVTARARKGGINAMSRNVQR